MLRGRIRHQRKAQQARPSTGSGGSTPTTEPARTLSSMIAIQLAQQSRSRARWNRRVRKHS